MGVTGSTTSDLPLPATDALPVACSALSPVCFVLVVVVVSSSFPQCRHCLSVTVTLMSLRERTEISAYT